MAEHQEDAQQEKEMEIRAAMAELARAFLTRDAAAIAAALDDDFTGSDPAGIVVSKERWVADVASGELVFTSIQSDEIELTHVDDESVRVRGQLTFAAHYSKSNYNGSFRYLGVYAKRGNRWKLLLSTARRVLPAD
jgi:ketosteroid isomerase-like protein